MAVTDRKKNHFENNLNFSTLKSVLLRQNNRFSWVISSGLIMKTHVELDFCLFNTASNADKNSSASSTSTDPLATRLEAKLENGQTPDNDNNLNVEKELREAGTQGAASDSTANSAEPDSTGDVKTQNKNNSNSVGKDINLKNHENGHKDTDDSKVVLQNDASVKSTDTEPDSTSDKGCEAATKSEEPSTSGSSSGSGDTASGSRGGTSSTCDGPSGSGDSSSGSSDAASDKPSGSSSGPGCSSASSSGSSSSDAGPSGSGCSSSAGPSGSGVQVEFSLRIRHLTGKKCILSISQHQALAPPDFFCKRIYADFNIFPLHISAVGPFNRLLLDF